MSTVTIAFAACHPLDVQGVEFRLIEVGLSGSQLLTVT